MRPDLIKPVPLRPSDPGVPLTVWVDSTLDKALGWGDEDIFKAEMLQSPTGQPVDPHAKTEVSQVSGPPQQQRAAGVQVYPKVSLYKPEHVKQGSPDISSPGHQLAQARGVMHAAAGKITDIGYSKGADRGSISHFYNIHDKAKDVVDKFEKQGVNDSHEHHQDLVNFHEMNTHLHPEGSKTRPESDYMQKVHGQLRDKAKGEHHISAVSTPTGTEPKLYVQPRRTPSPTEAAPSSTQTTRTPPVQATSPAETGASRQERGTVSLRRSLESIYCIAEIGSLSKSLFGPSGYHKKMIKYHKDHMKEHKAHAKHLKTTGGDRLDHFNTLEAREYHREAIDAHKQAKASPNNLSHYIKAKEGTARAHHSSLVASGKADRDFWNLNQKDRHARADNPPKVSLPGGKATPAPAKQQATLSTPKSAPAPSTSFPTSYGRTADTTGGPQLPDYQSKSLESINSLLKGHPMRKDYGYGGAKESEDLSKPSKINLPSLFPEHRTEARAEKKAKQEQASKSLDVINSLLDVA
jgi:hypothetical protein